LKPEKNKKEVKRIPKYIGDTEVYFPDFGKIVKKGDPLPELSLEEADRRSDFTVVEEDKQ